MALSPRIAARLTMLATLASAAIALLGALAMRDRVRLVDILTLFFGGAGAGAGLVALVVQRRGHRGAAPEHAHTDLHTPPTVSWREPASTDTRPPA